MKFPRSAFTLLAVLICATPGFADHAHKPSASDKSSASGKPSTPEMSEETRMDVIRYLSSELVYIRRPFPVGEKGLAIKDGKVSPDEATVARMVATYGPAVKPGDQAHITDVKFKGHNTIIFVINGGPTKKRKWYEHIQISGMGGTTTPTDPTADDKANIRGTFVALLFDKYVPELSVDQIKQMLRPVFDFDAKSAAEAYLDSLPPKVKEAIKNHQVLVGMDREMVTDALGRPPKKYRDRDGQTDYEEWIYGTPPQDVQFVRFVGDEVVRLEIMKVDGDKIVRDKKEFDMVKPPASQAQARELSPENAPKPANAPTLRRPGEAAPPGQPQSLPSGGIEGPEPKRLPPPPNPGSPRFQQEGFCRRPALESYPTLAGPSSPRTGAACGDGSPARRSRPA
jgi:hypothetical protein